MEKKQVSINSIKAGEEIYKQAIREYKTLQKVKDKISSEEYQIKNSIIGAKFALICEYYLKGLIIINLNIEIPDELKDKVPYLTEDEEVQLIVGDNPTKIRENDKFAKLSKKELGLLTQNSFKSLGHNLIRLLGTECIEGIKSSYLDEDIRRHILLGLVLGNIDNEREEASDFYKKIEECMCDIEKENSLSNEEKRKILVKTIERYIDNINVSEAFPKGRYGMYEGFEVDINFLKCLASAIRIYGVRSVYRNWVEVKDIDENISRFIIPDLNSHIKVYENDSEFPTRIFITKTHFKYGEHLTLQQISGDVVVGREMYENDYKSPINYIYFDYSVKDKLSIEYVQDKKKMRLLLEDGFFYEMEIPQNVIER